MTFSVGVVVTFNNVISEMLRVDLRFCKKYARSGIFAIFLINIDKSGSYGYVKNDMKRCVRKAKLWQKVGTVAKKPPIREDLLFGMPLIHVPGMGF